MAGYAYTPRFRVVYEDGPPEGTTYELTALLSNPGSPGPLSIRLEYIPEKVQRKNINRGLKERRFGSYIAVIFGFELSVMADEASLVAIYNALNDDRATTYLSLVSGGTERAVVLESYAWEPLAGKAAAGVSIEMRVQTVDVVETVLPIIGAGGVTQW